MEFNKKTICPLPFMAINVDDGGYRPCCHNKNNNWKKYNTINEYFKSNELKKLQKNLLAGIQDKSCNTCWQAEEFGLTSLRQEASNDRLQHVSENKLIQIQLQTGYVCNISCMMCSPGVSSNLNQLWKNKSMFEYHSYWNAPTLRYDQTMENYIKDNKNNIKYIEAVGGESFYNKKFITLIDWLIDENVAKNITMYITSNGTMFNDIIIKKLLKFKKTVILVSMEGVGAVNDYIRYGSKFTEIEKNFKKITKLFHYQIASTLSALNVHRYNELESFAKSYNSIIECKVVRSIPALLPNNCPTYLKKTIVNTHKKVTEQQSNEKLLKTFISLWDKQRQCSILDYMPEYKQLMEI